MLFMGEEWGASTPWQYFTDHTDPALGEAVRQGRRAEFAAHGWDRADVPDPQDPATRDASVLDWAEPGQDPHARLLRWYRDLIRLRREHPDLRDPRLDRARAEHDPGQGTVVVRRGEHLVLVNLADEPRSLDAEGRGQVLLSWDGGTTIEQGVVNLAPDSAAVLAP
jgi:maltooligosyltrehalose trehalohydrolase